LNVGELGVEFPIRLEADHVVNLADQVKVFAVKGFGNQTLNSSLRSRQSPEYAVALSSSIQVVLKNVKAGVLVFFPSYSLLEDTMNTWKGDGTIDSIERSIGSQIFVEPRSARELQAVLQQYYDTLDKGAPRTAVLFAVGRGKVSEGINFSDHYARAVIIVGIPYLPVTDTFVKLKQAYQDQKHKLHSERYLKGCDWYTQEAFRSINQSIGRCIRHINDFGVILLFDSRFHGKREHSNLSKWLRASVTNYDCATQTILPITNFFESMSKPALLSSTTDNGGSGGSSSSSSFGGDQAVNEGEGEDSFEMTQLYCSQDHMEGSYFHDWKDTDPMRLLEYKYSPIAPYADILEVPPHRAWFYDCLTSIQVTQLMSPVDDCYLLWLPSLVVRLGESIQNLNEFYECVSKELPARNHSGDQLDYLGNYYESVNDWCVVSTSFAHNVSNYMAPSLQSHASASHLPPIRLEHVDIDGCFVRMLKIMIEVPPVRQDKATNVSTVSGSSSSRSSSSSASSSSSSVSVSASSSSSGSGRDSTDSSQNRREVIIAIEIYAVTKPQVAPLLQQKWVLRNLLEFRHGIASTSREGGPETLSSLSVLQRMQVEYARAHKLLKELTAVAPRESNSSAIGTGVSSLCTSTPPSKFSRVSGDESTGLTTPTKRLRTSDTAYTAHDK
jgi:uncharacterized membrane protein YgcG